MNHLRTNYYYISLITKSNLVPFKVLIIFFLNLVTSQQSKFKYNFHTARNVTTTNLQKKDITLKQIGYGLLQQIGI